MILLTPDMRFALRANAIAHRTAERLRQPEPDPAPVLKLFNPLGAATWLATELGEDGDTLFGLADLGFGCPELGCFSLSEIASLRLPYGLGIERDLLFRTRHPLSLWAEAARAAGSIPAAELMFRHACRHGRAAPDLPPTSKDEGADDAGGASRRQPQAGPSRLAIHGRTGALEGASAMRLDFLPLDKLAVSKANMRYAKRPPDVSDILPTVRARGVLVPLIVRPNGAPGAFEIVAGSRRFHAARIVADETGQAEPLPCAILDAGDDAAAIEASLIENLARLDPDEVTQWETFTRLVREGRTVDDIAATFGLPDLAVRRVLALGNLLPRIRAMYAREEIDRATVRHLTLASKSQQRAWLALADDPNAYLPTGHQLKAWLLGGQSISTRDALFDVAASGLAVVADLFGEDSYFADADAFWTQQEAAIEARRADYLDAGWPDAVIVPASEHFQSWEYEKAPKRKGGRVYIDVRASGEVIFHEGYLSRAEARRIARGEQAEPPAKPPRPEVSGPMQAYIDLHRHAAARAALLAHPGVALRLMLAHAIAGSPLWSVRAEPQTARSDETRESVETSRGETLFDERRRAVLALLGFSPDEPTVVEGRPEGADGDTLAAIFWRLLGLPDAAVMDAVAVVMGECLAAGSAAVEAVGLHIDLDMADWWQADPAFFGLARDREVLAALVAEVAGEAVASANAREKGKTLKRIIADCLAGENGRAKRERWVPRWMAFPPAAYTQRGGVGTVRAHALAEAARAAVEQPEPPAPDAGALPPEPECEPVPEAAEPVPLAA